MGDGVVFVVHFCVGCFFAFLQTFRAREEVSFRGRPLEEGEAAEIAFANKCRWAIAVASVLCCVDVPFEVVRTEEALSAFGTHVFFRC